jgi:predicted RNase H-like nuclease/chloramphenicol 3-O-phosphotransferase
MVESNAIFLITGPMAAGKSTVARLLAQKFERGVHLEGDIFRRSIVAGREEITPDLAPEALAQLRLRYRLAAMVVDAYFQAGFTVVLEDVIAGPLLPECIELIRGRPLHVVVLLPPIETVVARETSREAAGYTSWPVEELYEGFVSGTPRLGLWLDTSGQAPAETVEEILARSTPLGPLPRPGPSAPAAGIDACPGGWAVAVWHPNGEVDVFRVASFEEAVRLDVAAIAVDIPIGAPQLPPRAADLAARAYVGERSSSVFPTPPRAVLDAPDYTEALRRHRALTGKGLSKQAYYLCRRMLEVEPHALADERIVEVHPEVSFRELAGRTLSSKHTAEGLAERRTLLEEAGIMLLRAPVAVPLVDAYDAAVAAWTAARWARGEARSLPEDHVERIGAIWC